MKYVLKSFLNKFCPTTRSKVVLSNKCLPLRIVIDQFKFWIGFSSNSICEHIFSRKIIVLGTSVNFSSSSEPSKNIFEPSRARAISQKMIFEPSRARAEKASSAFEREQNRASMNHFSSMILFSISSIVERNSSGNRANTEQKSSINQKPVQFLSKKYN